MRLAAGGAITALDSVQRDWLLRSGGDMSLLADGSSEDSTLAGRIAMAKGTALRIEIGEQGEPKPTTGFMPGVLNLSAAGLVNVQEQTDDLWLASVVSSGEGVDGALTLQAATGEILASERIYHDGVTHVSGQDVRLVSGTLGTIDGARNLGSLLRPLRLEAQSLAASAYTGQSALVHIANTGDLELRQLELTSGQVLLSTSGSLRVVQAVQLTSDAGNRLSLTAMDGDIDLRNDLTMGRGQMLLSAAKGQVLQSSNSDVLNAGGAITLNALGLAQAWGATLSSHASSQGGNITLRVSGDVVASSINASTGVLDVQSTEGRIVEALDLQGQGDAAADLAGATMKLEAQAIGALGRGGQALETSASTLTVSASGDVALSNDKTLGLLGLTAGSAVMRTSAGNLNVDGPVAAQQNLLLEAGTGGSVSVKADTGVSVVQGALSILAAQGINLGSGSVVSGLGSVDLQAAAGALAMNASARIASGGGNIRLAAGTDIVLGTVDARLANGAVNANGSRLGVLAGGSISSAWLLPAATDANLRGADALLQAGTGIGNDLGALRLDVARVSAHTTAGDIHLYALGDLEIGAVADLRIERVVETGRTAALWTLEQSGLRAAGRVVVSSVGSLKLLTDPALDAGAAIRTGALGQVSLTAAGAINVPNPGPADVPLIDTRVLSLSASSIAAMVLAVDEISATASTGGLTLADVNREGESKPGLTVKDIAAAGNVSITAQSTLSVEKIRTGNNADVSLMSLAGDLLMLVADALANNLDELSLLAAGFIGSPRLFTGATRTEYRSGAALRLAGSASQLPAGAKVVEPTDLAATPAVAGLSAVLPTQHLVLRSDSTITLAGSHLPRGATTTLQAAQGLFMSQAVANQASSLGQALQAPQILVMTPGALSAVDEQAALTLLNNALNAGPPPLLANPTVALPGALPVTPSVASPLRMPANAFGSGSETLTVTLKLASGQIGGTPPTGISASGSVSERSFTGQASALSNWFASATAPTYLGAADQSLNITVTRSAVSVQTALALYGSSAASSTAPSLAAVPQTVFITAGTASSLSLAGLQISGEGPLTLSATAPTGGSLSAATATGVSAGGSANALTFTGTASALQAWLAGANALVYSGNAGTLTLRLADASGQRYSQLTVALATPTVSSASQTSGALMLPTQIAATPGAALPLKWAANAVSSSDAAQVLALELGLPQSAVSLSSLEGTGVTVSNGASLTMAGNTFAATRLSGTAAALNALLSGGAVSLQPTAPALINNTLGVRLTSSGGSSDASVAITLASASGSQSTASLGLSLPAALGVSAGATPIVVQAALSGPAGTYSLNLNAGSATLTAASSSALSPVTSAGTLTLSGTLDELNTYLASGNLSVSGGAGQSLTLTVQQGSSARAQVSLALLALAAPLPVLALPSTVFVLPATSSPVILGGAPISGSGSFTLSLTAVGSLSATETTLDGSDASTAVSGSSVTLSGTASELNDYLNSGKLRFTGTADTLLLALQPSGDSTRQVQARIAVAAIMAPTSVAAPTLALPAGFTVLENNGQLTLPADALGSGPGLRTLLLSTSGGTLAASGLSGAGLTALGSGTAALTLSGTQTALSTYLATAGNVLFNGTAGQNYALTATAQVISGSLVQAATTRQATVAAVAAVQLGSSGTATAPVITALPSSLTVIPGSASTLVLSGAELDDGNSAADDTLVLTLGVAGGALSATADGTVTVGGSGTSLSLTGTAAQLQTFVRAHSISYKGQAGALSLTLARAAAPNGAAASTTLALLAADSQPLGGNAAATLVLPATVQTTPGVSAALPFGSVPLVAAGPVTLALNATGASLSWDGDAGLKVSSAGAAVSGGTGNALSLYGTAEQINAYLAAGKVKASGNGTVSVTLNGGTSGVTGGTGAGHTMTVSTATASASAVSLPTLTLPSAMTVSTSNGQITLAANALGSGTAERTVVISTSVNALTATGLGGSAVNATGSASNASTITLTGTEQALSTYLATAGKLVFSGSAGSYTLTVQAQSASGADRIVKTAAITALAPLGATGTANTAAALPSLALPATLTVPRINGEIRFANAIGDSSEILTLVMSVAEGPVSGNPTLTVNGNDVAVTVAGSASSSLTLSGSASALRSFLDTPGRILFNGAASSTAYTLTASLQRLDVGVVRAAVTAVASLTAVLPATGTTSGRATAPVLALPETLFAGGASGNGIQFVSGVVSANDANAVLTLNLTLSGGPSASATLSSSLFAQGQTSHTASATGAGGVASAYDAVNRVLTLSGTAAALNAYLQTSGRVLLSGSASVVQASAAVQPYTLTFGVFGLGGTDSGSTSRAFPLINLGPGFTRELYQLNSSIVGSGQNLTKLDELFAGTQTKAPTPVGNYPSVAIDSGLNGVLDTAPSSVDIGDHFAMRLSGWLTVPETGNYRFALKANDAARLYLSTINRAGVDRATDLIISRSSIDGANENLNNNSAKSEPIHLKAGEFYRFEVVSYETNEETVAFNREHVQLGYTYSATGTPSSTFGADPNLPTAWLIPKEYDDVLMAPSVEQGLVAITSFSSPSTTVSGRKNFANSLGGNAFVAVGSGQPAEWVSKTYGSTTVASGITMVQSTSDTGAGSNYLELEHGLAANGWRESLTAGCISTPCCLI